MSITFAEVAEQSASRAEKWHADNGGLNSWSLSDWAVAMMGEAGEACNIIKKLNRVRDGMRQFNRPGREIKAFEDGVEKLGEELADTVLYAFLLAHRCGIKLDEAVVKKFNATSVEGGFSERLHLEPNALELGAAVRRAGLQGS